jgi:hypothetical protein
MQIKQPEKLLKDIRIIRGDLAKSGIKLPPSLAGIYGEVLAYQKMKKYFEPKGFVVEFGSGQSKADIQLVKNRKVINVEIKTSRLKEEWFGTGFGFAINIKRCKSHKNVFFKHPSRGDLPGDFCYFDYIVTIALKNDLSGADFYVFPKAFIIEHEPDLRNKNERFKSGSHRIIFPVKPSGTKEITKFDIKLMKNRSKFKNAWNLIKER